MLLGWSQADLCERSGVSRPTVSDLEGERGDPKRSSIGAVEAAFHKAGVVFTDDGREIGVRVPKGGRR
jgi:transcriptional regulator with XRE-family HTH domain